MFMNAGRFERATAGADGDLAPFEVTEELGPFIVGGDPVLLGGTQCATAGEERQVGLDGFVGVDGPLEPRVTLKSRWPAMICAICGGRPLMMVSVMKIRRKSCGVKRSGRPSRSVRPV